MVTSTLERTLEDVAAPPAPKASGAALGEGFVLAGRYVLGRVLGAGGMGVVFEARHRELGIPLAVKLLRGSCSPAAELRFRREARAQARLRTEFVARVFDAGVLEDGVLEHGAPFLVMERLQGEDVAAYLTRRGPLSVRTAVDWALMLACGLADAHGQGIIHRDLKPSNVFVTKDVAGKVTLKILDFGLAKWVGTDARLTRTGQGMGSWGYVAPEQLRDAVRADERADVWSLGALLYEWVTGEAIGARNVRVSDGESPLFEQTSRPSGEADALEAVVARCLRVRREDRFATVADLARALAPLASPSARPLADRARLLRGASRTGRSPTFASFPSPSFPAMAKGAAVVAAVAGVTAVAGVIAAAGAFPFGLSRARVEATHASEPRAKVPSESVASESVPPEAPRSTFVPLSDVLPPAASSSASSDVARPYAARTALHDGTRPAAPERRPSSATHGAHPPDESGMAAASKGSPRDGEALATSVEDFLDTRH